MGRIFTDSNNKNFEGEPLATCPAPAKQMEKSEHEELIEELRLIKEILQKILNHVRNRL